MQHYTCCSRLLPLLIVLVTVFAVTAQILPAPEVSNTTQLPLKLCAMAAKCAAYVNVVYVSGRSDGSSDALERRLLKCMSTLPTVVLLMESYSREPQRTFSTFNAFVMPAATSTAAAHVRLMETFLDGKHRQKCRHKYAFLWPAATRSQLQALFELLWLKGILNAVVVTDPQSAYTYEPFSESGFRVRLLHNDTLFYDKLRNMHRQPLRITMFTDNLRASPRRNSTVNGYTAVDGYLAGAVVAQLNATGNYITPRDKHNFGECKNDSCTGALKDLADGVSDVNFNARFLMTHEEPVVELLYPFGLRTIFLIVPAAEMLPEYLIFVNAFSCSVWRLLALHFFIVVAVFRVLQSFAQKLPESVAMKHGRWYELFEIFLKTQLGEPVEGFSGISSLREFLIGWILFSYVLTSVYFAKLESSFVHPTFEPEIDTLDDLHRLTAPIYVVSGLFDVVKSAVEPKHWKLIEQRAVHLPSSHSSHNYALKMAQQTKPHAFVLRGGVAKVFMDNTYNVEEERHTFHVVKKNLRSKHRGYTVPLGSPFAYKFHEIEAILFESGIFEYWVSRFARFRRHNSYQAEEFQAILRKSFAWRKDKIVLNLNILQGAFYLWLFGILFSVIGFGMEYAYRCCKANRNVKVTSEAVA